MVARLGELELGLLGVTVATQAERPLQRVLRLLDLADALRGREPAERHEQHDDAGAGQQQETAPGPAAPFDPGLGRAQQHQRGRDRRAREQPRAMTTPSRAR